MYLQMFSVTEYSVTESILTDSRVYRLPLMYTETK